MIKVSVALVVLMLSSTLFASTSSISADNIEGSTDSQSTADALSPQAKGTSIMHADLEQKTNKISMKRVMGVASFAQSNFDTSTPTSGRNGMGMGALLELGSPVVTLETGVMFREMGARIGGNSDLQINYIGVPIISKYYLQPYKRNSLYVSGGVIPSFVVQKPNNSKINNAEYNNFTENMRSFEVTGSASFGARIAVGSQFSAMVEANYLRGLTLLEEKSALYNTSFGIVFGVSREL